MPEHHLDRTAVQNLLREHSVPRSLHHPTLMIVDNLRRLQEDPELKKNAGLALIFADFCEQMQQLAFVARIRETHTNDPAAATETLIDITAGSPVAVTSGVEPSESGVTISRYPRSRDMNIVGTGSGGLIIDAEGAGAGNLESFIFRDGYGTKKP